MKFFALDELTNLYPTDSDPSLWTAVIPAAGRGSRLGYDKPKILYPVAGRPILDWLIDLLEPRCETLIFILSPGGAPHVAPLIEQRLGARGKVVIQEEPKGMADAIYQAVPHIVTPYTFIIWGDQVAIQPPTVQAVQKLQQFNAKTVMTLPIVERDEPYVHYATDASGRFTHALERREGADMPPVGQSDCGVFAFNTKKLQSVFAKAIKQGITLSAGTKEWNFIPMLPQFDTGGDSVAALALDSPEETIGVNNKDEGALLEAYLQKKVPARASSDKLKVVLFSGGRGTGTISDALLKYPDIDLKFLVNAYDDGKSTGLLRRFIPGMLGPSDIRKVVSNLLKHKTDSASKALCELMEFRFPDDVTTADALNILTDFLKWDTKGAANHPVLQAREKLSLAQIRLADHYLQAFLDYYHEEKAQRDFTFADNSLGNLFFAGCYLLGARSFNRAIELFCDFAEVGRDVVNITQGENCALVGLKSDGRFMADEATVQGPQDAVPIEEIFLLPDYRGPVSLKLTGTKDVDIATLREMELLPHISPEADVLLREADIIIYGPGTQHSSLYPSYMTVGVAEAIAANPQSEKIFIANIVRDNDILAEDATTLIDEFLWSMSRKETLDIRGRDYISRFFFQKPEKHGEESPDYLPFRADEFPYPLDRVVWIDLEGEKKGSHAGGRTVSELLLIIESQLRKRVRHVSHMVSIVIPALNEEATIGRVLHEVRDLALPGEGLEKDIIVVDGGSTDKTYNVASLESGVRVFQLEGATGRGKALQLGVQKARGEIIVFFPSDGEYLVSDIARVINPLLQHEFPVVFGSRAFRSDLSGTLQQVYGSRGVMFLFSKYGGMLLSILSLLIYHRFITDPLTSLKAFNARLFREMTFERAGVDFDMELIAKISRARYSILEVPVSYMARTVQEGKKITLGDGFHCLLTLLRFGSYTPPSQNSQTAAPLGEEGLL